MASNRSPNEAAYQNSVETVIAYLDDSEADVYNLVQAAVETDAMGASLRLARLAAEAVQELATATGETPSTILHRLTEWTRT